MDTHTYIYIEAVVIAYVSNGCNAVLISVSVGFLDHHRDCLPAKSRRVRREVVVFQIRTLEEQRVDDIKARKEHR